MLQGVVIDEASERLFACAGPWARSPGAGTLEQALGALRGKALHPCAQGRIGAAEGRRDRGAGLTCASLTDRLRTAKDPGHPGLLEYGLSGDERLIANVACEGAHGLAP